MRNLLLCVSVGLVFALIGCDQKSDASQKKTTVSNSPRSSGNTTQVESRQRAMGNPPVSSAAPESRDLEHRSNSDDQDVHNVVSSQRTIRQEAESAGREMDCFEEQMDRLQAAVEKLLQD